MNKFLKVGLLTAAGVLSVAVAGGAYLALTFNPNDYKEKIIQVVKDSKQRTLHLDGDISLSFFPNIGAKVNRVALSEFQNEKEFAAIESVRVSLALLPLFSKQVVVNELSLSGLHATLIKHKDGTSNIDDLLSPPVEKTPQPASAPVQFDIAKVVIAKTNLAYVDELSGANYAINDLELSTSRIAPNVPVKIALAVGVTANQPKLAIQTDLKTTLTFDLDKQSYQLADLKLAVTGAALDMTKLQLNVSGAASANLATQEFSANKLLLKVSGVKGTEGFSADLSAPELNLASDHYTGSGVTLNAKLDAAFGQLVAALAIPAVSGNAQAFKVDNLSVDATLTQPAQTFKVKLTSPLAGNMHAQQFALSNLSIALNATGDALPNKAVSSELKGNVNVDLKQQNVQVNLAGGVLQSQVRAKLGLRNFAQAALNFDVDVDQFDADLYLPKANKDAPKAAAQPEANLDLSALRSLNLDGSLRIGALKVANVKVEKLRVDVAAHKGVLSINPLAANLYGGSTSGSISVNAQAIPSIAIVQNLSGIDIAPLGKDAANFDTLEGHGNVALNLTMQGNKVSEMKRALNGTANLSLVDGAIKGINVAKKMRDAKAMFGAKSDSQAANKAEKTDFSELKASFKITNGVAHNDDLSMKSPLLRLSGTGDINFGNDSINYLAKATLAKTLEGQGGADSVGGLTLPVRVSGAFTDLKYGLEWSAMVNDQTKQKVADVKAAAQAKVGAAKDAAKQQVEVKKEEVKTQVQDQLKSGLKGLFK
jgi:AsmA protein